MNNFCQNFEVVKGGVKITCDVEGILTDQPSLLTFQVIATVKKDSSKWLNQTLSFEVTKPKKSIKEYCAHYWAAFLKIFDTAGTPSPTVVDSYKQYFTQYCAALQKMFDSIEDTQEAVEGYQFDENRFAEILNVRFK
jgi:lysyl-tRNA synthetase class I